MVVKVTNVVENHIFFVCQIKKKQYLCTRN